MPAFALNKRIEQDSVLLGKLRICEVRLANDSRWPWLILVPQVGGAEEIHNLSTNNQEAVSRDTNDCARVLQEVTQCDTINCGSLGNIVRQLHIHVIARTAGDPNWPNAIWGFEDAVPYADDARDVLLDEIGAKLLA